MLKARGENYITSDFHPKEKKKSLNLNEIFLKLLLIIIYWSFDWKYLKLSVFLLCDAISSSNGEVFSLKKQKI